MEASTLAWRPLVTAFAGDIPVGALLAWIDEESHGHPCATGMIVDGATIESGIFQLMSPGNTTTAGVTPAQLRAACAGPASARLARALTPDEQLIQVTSGIRYVQTQRLAARQALAAVGATWPETGGDFWAMVKSRHGLPAIASELLPVVTRVLGRAPVLWDEFVETYQGLPVTQIPASLQRFFLAASRHGYRNRLDDVLANATAIKRAVDQSGPTPHPTSPTSPRATPTPAWQRFGLGAVITVGLVGLGWGVIYAAKRVLTPTVALGRPRSKP